MIERKIDLDESFFDKYDPVEALKLKDFLYNVDSEFRSLIIEVEQENADGDPIKLGLVMNFEISAIIKELHIPDFTHIGLSREEINSLVNFLAKEALSDYYRQF